MILACPLLLCGCVPGASPASTVLADVQAFAVDFGRQVLAALLL